MKILGYTLVEMVIVVGLTALLGVAIVAMFLSTARGGGKAGALARVKEEGEYAISTLERQIRFAVALESDEGGCDGTIIYPIDAGDFILYLPDGRVYQYYKYNTQLVRDYDDPGPPEVSGKGEAVTSAEVEVTNFSFNCYDQDGVIKATVVLELGIGRESVSEEFTSSVVLRNTY